MNPKPNQMPLLFSILVRWPFNILLTFLLFLATTAAAAQPRQLQVDISQTISEIQPTMYGIFFEDINFAADGGLYPELVKNRSFEFDDPMMGWSQPNTNFYGLNKDSGTASILSSSDGDANRNFCRVTVMNDQKYVLYNEGFKGMGVKAGATYRLSLLAANPSGGIKKINFQLVDSLDQVLGETTIIPAFRDWTPYSTLLTARQTEEKARLKITFSGSGTIDLDQISLFPEDTWKRRKNGLRKDLVQLLYDLKPGFLRFPGGCIVEGRTLDQRYQWKKTVGPLEERELLINRWNTEFAHRPAPDYFQSFGLGFFEYFQLAEDLGAEPLPIVGCGMACQFNTGELVPLDELEPYVKDALDLIEFANGPLDSPWGKVRSDMGHPEPFRMKYIGIGNEQWGPGYIERYKVFAQAIQDRYPEMIIIASSGPFAGGDFFEYGWEEFRKLKAAIIDEHYYQNPEWFRANAGRYDDYDRNGPRIFAGEYAAQSVRTGSPENKNNWETALSEAAFMTGLERNADIVHLTSYAPLMAHAEGWQWTPDLIWFNNLEAYGTPNYYVQQLFSTNRGTHLLRLTENGRQLSGQERLYASAVLDKGTGTLIVKMVNTSDRAQEVTINLQGGKGKARAELITLNGENLKAENSFEKPKNISPEEKSIPVDEDRMILEIPSIAMVVVKVHLK